MPRDTILKKRSVRVSGHDTSITLEEPFWLALQNIAQERKTSINQLISMIDETRDNDLSENTGNLSSTLRLYVLQHLQDKLAQ